MRARAVSALIATIRDRAADRMPGGLRRRVERAGHTPAVGVATLALLVLVAAVGAAPGEDTARASDNDVTPLAAIAPAPVDPDDPRGPAVIAVARTPRVFHVAAAAVSAPPPSIVVNSPGAMRIPALALAAYRNAERKMAAAAPNCGVSWNLLAGIGRIESVHANGGRTDARGNPVPPIFGPALDGSLPGNEVIISSRSANRVEYMRAVGPMQFLPTTWGRYASDGDGDGKADVQNLFDAALGAARYLCSGNLNLRDQSQVISAVLRYNNSMPYARNVLGWAAAYATGVAPLDLPPITGSVPPIGDSRLETTEHRGGGRGDGLSPADPLARLPLAELVSGASHDLYPAGGGPASPLGAPPAQFPTCVILCPPPPAMVPPGLPAPVLPAPAFTPPLPPGASPAVVPGRPAPTPQPSGGPPATGSEPAPALGPLPGPAVVS